MRGNHAGESEFKNHEVALFRGERQRTTKRRERGTTHEGRLDVSRKEVVHGVQQKSARSSLSVSSSYFCFAPVQALRGTLPGVIHVVAMYMFVTGSCVVRRGSRDEPVQHGTRFQPFRSNRRFGLRD